MTASTPLPVKTYIRKPDDTDALPANLSLLLDRLLKIRREERPHRGDPDPAAICVPAARIADRCGWSLGHTKRLLGQLARAYPWIILEYPSPTERVIRFAYALAGDPPIAETPPSPRPRRARRAGPGLPLDSPGAPVHPSTGAPEMPTLGAPDVSTPGAPARPLLRESSESPESERELTLNAAGPQPERSAPPLPDGGTPTAETSASRETRLKAHLDGLSAEERAAILEKVKAENPGIGRFRAMIEPLCLVEVAANHPDLYPPVAEPTPAPPPPTRPARPDVEARRLLRIGEPTGPDSVEAAVAGLMALTGGHHMHGFFSGVVEDARAHPHLADEIAGIIHRAVDPAKGLPPYIKSPDHYVSTFITQLRERKGLRPPRGDRGRARP